MTIYTVFRLCDTFAVSLDSLVIVDESAAQVIGTTANLLPNDVLSVHELLFGLMLPSGNDAAHLLGCHFGRLIVDLMRQAEDCSLNEELRKEIKLKLSESADFSKQSGLLSITRSKRNPFLARKSFYRDNEYLSAFIAEMNKNCARLGLQFSFFDSPHGLMNSESKSTAFDTAKLAAKCLTDVRFLNIVQHKNYRINKSLRKNKR